MRPPVRALLALVAVLVTALAGLAAPARAADAKQLVYGGINCPKLAKCPNTKVLWFDQDWGYLGTARANGGGYSLRLAPGRYHLQFVDQRPAYDTSKYAPTDIAVTVGQHPVSKSVTMKRGGAITGVARAGGKPLRHARIVAANRSEQSFATTANGKGQFAVGGLPAGQYCLFTYDRAERYVGKCTWVGGVDFGQVKDSRVTLTKKSGNLTVFLTTRDGGRAPAATVTVTSRSTGQWWTVRARGGRAVLRGLYPGRYDLKYDGGGVWLAATGAVHGGSVRPQRMAFGDFTVPKRGAWVTGTVVDGSAPGYPMAEAQVRLFDASGRLVASATSDADGIFRLEGQLTTQDGMTVVVDPKLNSGGWMQGGLWCKFDSGSFGPVSITTGVQSFVGDIALPRATTPDQTAECRG